MQCLRYMYFILYYHRKSIGYVWRGIKTIFRPQELYRAGTAPPVLKFLDPPLVYISSFYQWNICFYIHMGLLTDLIIVWRFVVMLNIENLKIFEHQAFNMKRKVGYVQLWKFCWNIDVCCVFFFFFQSLHVS